MPGILHVDMDAFFVSVELRRRPELRGQPVVVGGAGPRGVVAAASYEARRYGIHSAMPSAQARRLCRTAVFLAGDHAHYEQVSAEVFAVFRSFTPLVEGLSLDEAFLDVTGARRLLGDGPTIAALVRERVRATTGLTCSVGVAPNKFLAKLASEAAKPRATSTGVQPGAGVVVVEPGNELSFLHPQVVEVLWGVGPATLDRLRRLGVVTVGDLASLSPAALSAALGRSVGTHLHRLAHGEDDRVVEPDRATKSIGHEQTFPRDLYDDDQLAGVVVRLAEAVGARLRDAQMAGRTVTLKLRFGSFATITRSASRPEPVDTSIVIAELAKGLLAQIDCSPGVRLLGVSVSQLTTDRSHQLSLALTSGVVATSWRDATEALDEIRRRYGDGAIGPARLVGPPGAAGGGLRPFRRGERQWGPDGSPPGPAERPAGGKTDRAG